MLPARLIRHARNTQKIGYRMSAIGLRSAIRRQGDITVSSPLPELITVNEDPDETRPKLSVIIPTRNETRNVAPLLERLRAALAGIPAEIIFVDDSDDDTAEEIDRAGRSMQLPVRLLQRGPDQREGGLGTAVVSGMKAASAPWALVMDADLQHPPEVVPQLFATATRQNVDLVVPQPVRRPRQRGRSRLRRPPEHLAVGHPDREAGLPPPRRSRQRPDERLLRRPTRGSRPRAPAAARLQDPARADRADGAAAHGGGQLHLRP